nr:sugar transferase [uncultured Oribacterium sp.]
MKILTKLCKVIVAISIFAGGVAFVMEILAERKTNNKKCKGVYEKFIKRPVDCFLATLCLLIFSPLMLILAIFVRIFLGSPVLFEQDRPGKNGKVFKLYKFRTMTDKRDENGQLLADELRLTAFGKMLRASSLDELPELLNIIKGEMSLIGPRPLLVQYLPLYNQEQARRHEVRPGLTGLAQSKGRNSLSWEEKFKLDVEYVDHITFLGDMKIIIDTIRGIINAEGISAVGEATMPFFTGIE